MMYGVPGIAAELLELRTVTSRESFAAFPLENIEMFVR
jgi:hypothetical protein